MRGERGELKHLMYPQEKKEKSIPRVVASEIGRAQTMSSNTHGVRTTTCY